MKQADFDGMLKKPYQVILPDGDHIEIVLKEVGVLKPPSDSAPDLVRRDPFFLVFNGPADAQLPADALKLRGPGGEEYVLSFNAEGYIDDDPEKGYRYYVVVN